MAKTPVPSRNSGIAPTTAMDAGQRHRQERLAVVDALALEASERCADAQRIAIETRYGSGDSPYNTATSADTSGTANHCDRTENVQRRPHSTVVSAKGVHRPANSGA